MHRHGLTIKGEGGRGSSRIDVDSRVGMHAPHDSTRRVDIILQENLLTSVNSTDATLVGGPVNIRSVKNINAVTKAKQSRTPQHMHLRYQQ